jgi:hypothetical protein
MRAFILFSLTFFSLLSFADVTNNTSANSNLVDPDLIDSEMTQVMYLIGPKDIKTTSYQGGYPSNFNLKLCTACMPKPYKLEEGAELLLNEQPLDIKDLTISLIKKQFDVIQLGIDRTTRTVSYIYLGGISELSTGEL